MSRLRGTPTTCWILTLAALLLAVPVSAGVVRAADEVVVRAADEVVLREADEIAEALPFAPGLERVIRQALALPEGPITPAHAARIRELRAAFSDIESLEGIQYLVALETLDLACNYISDISPLSGLVLLRSLDLSGNQISDLSPLAHLQLLEELNLSNNRLESLAGLENLHRLRTLDISFNPVQDLEPLRGLTVLESLDAMGAQIADLSPLSELRRVRSLALDGNRIADISPLSGLTNLERLSLAKNAIVDVTPLARMANLQSLVLDLNQVKDVTPLKRLRSLQRLSAIGNRLTDIEPLAKLPELRYADFSFNRIRSVGPWVVEREARTIILSGNPIDPASVPESVMSQVYGTLRREHRKGDYTVRFYMLEDEFREHAEVWRGDELVWTRVSGFIELPGERYSEGMIDDAVRQALEADENLLVITEFTGGLHCCTYVHVLRLKPEFKVLESIAGLHSFPLFNDLDGDGTLEVAVQDWTFAYWKASFAESPAPVVVLKLDGERFRVAPELMRHDPPPFAALAQRAAEILSDDRWEEYKTERGVLTGPPPQLWTVMLDLIYTGHWSLAFRFLDMAWPDDVEGKEVFARAFVEQLQSSPYWKDILELMYGGSVTHPSG